MNTFYGRFAATAAVLALVGGMTFLISRAGHTSGGPVAVQVANTPLATTSADGPDQQPFATRLDVLPVNGYGLQKFTVPAGKRLVIDYVSAVAFTNPGSSVQMILTSTVNGQEVESRIPLIAQGTLDGSDSYSASESTHIYADPGTEVDLVGVTSNHAGNESLTIGVYGHYVNVAVIP